MGYKIPWTLQLVYVIGITAAGQFCDDEDLDCTSEGSGNEGSGDYGVIDGKNLRNGGSEETEGASVIDLFTGKKFLAAVVSGSCVGLLLASMAMMLVLCKARRDNSLRQYNYSHGTKNDGLYA